MAEPNPDLKGVIQVKDGPGWSPLDSKKVFQPIMDAINAIRSVDLNIYIGLSYGANAHTQTPAMFKSYGFPDSVSIRDATKKLDPAATIDTVSIPNMLNIMKGGTGQAAVLSSKEVNDMLTDVKKFIIIPFDTMNSKSGDKSDDPKAYGHKDDCLAFAQKFLDLDKSKGGSIIIGWQPNTSNLDLINTSTDRKQATGVEQGEYEKLHFALGAGAADVDATVVEYIDFLISKWDKESQKFIESKIASGKKKPDDETGKTKLDDVEKLDDDATEKKAAGITEDQKNNLKTRLETVNSKILNDPGDEKNTAYGIAQEIFAVFFSGGDKTKQTKDFLTSQVTELAKLGIFGKEGKRKDELAGISKRLENPATAKKIELEEEEDPEKAAAEKKRKEEEAEKKRKEDLEKAAAEKKRKEEEEDARKKGSIGKQLRVMTFNTWYEALGINPKQAFCTDSGTNKCQDNIRAAILAEMDKPGPVVIFLQEFTYNFEEFFGPLVTVDKSNKIESLSNVAKGIAIKAFRHFKIDYKGRKFYVYIGQIGNSVMATIYSSDLADESATEFFMGNLASGMNTGGDPNKHEIVTTFSGDAKLKIDDIKHAGKPYDFRGGNRPFTILRFDTTNLKLILLNIHSPHPDVFGDLHDGNPPNPDPGAPKDPITVAQFAFTALGPFFDEHVFTSGSGVDKKDYTFVAGGDFNTDANTAIDRLTPIFQDANNTIDRNTNKTCCTDKGGTTFTSTVDHIFSTSVIRDYKVYDPNATKLETTTTTPPNPRYYFSDHLPVYATVTLLTVPAKVPVSNETSSSSSSSSSSAQSGKVPTEQNAPQNNTGVDASSTNTTSKISSSSDALSSGSNVHQQVESQADVSEGPETHQIVESESGASGASSATPSEANAVSIEAVESGKAAPVSVIPAPVPAPAPVTTSAPSGPITSITIMPSSK
jgi:hypothetical protein